MEQLEDSSLEKDKIPFHFGHIVSEFICFSNILIKVTFLHDLILDVFNHNSVTHRDSYMQNKFIFRGNLIYFRLATYGQIKISLSQQPIDFEGLK